MSIKERLDRMIADVLTAIRDRQNRHIQVKQINKLMFKVNTVSWYPADIDLLREVASMYGFKVISWNAIVDVENLSICVTVFLDETGRLNYEFWKESKNG